MVLMTTFQLSRSVSFQTYGTRLSSCFNRFLFFCSWGPDQTFSFFWVDLLFLSPRNILRILRFGVNIFSAVLVNISLWTSSHFFDFPTKKTQADKYRNSKQGSNNRQHYFEHWIFRKFVELRTVIDRLFARCWVWAWRLFFTTFGET